MPRHSAKCRAASVPAASEAWNSANTLSASFTYEEDKSTPFGIRFSADSSTENIVRYDWDFGEVSRWDCADEWHRGGEVGYSRQRKPARRGPPLNLK